MTAKDVIKEHLDSDRTKDSIEKCMESYAEQQAIEFAKWLNRNGWAESKNNTINRWFKNQHGYFTTSELYQQFKNKP